MNKLLGFVPSLLDLVSNVLNEINGGVTKLAKMSVDNPKTSGVTAIVLGWIGLDISILADVGGWVVNFGTWVQSLGLK